MAAQVLDREENLVEDASLESGLVPRQKHAAPRIVRVGLLGFGRVGSALARTLKVLGPLAAGVGIDIRLTTALVRDGRRLRPDVPRALALTADPAAFFDRRHDVVIEVMGGVHPAADYVRRLLKAGVTVVTANKSLLAAEGDALHEAARRGGCRLHAEASALAGVPFLTTLRRRPLAARATSVSGIFNGTTNYIFSRIAADGIALPAALREAQGLGLAESDPVSDLSGRDAAEKLIVILQHIGLSGAAVSALEINGVETVRPSDFAAARRLGGALKPVVAAAIDLPEIRGFVGPAWVPETSPLARLEGEENGVRFSNGTARELFFSGPGAGPDVTAQTIWDDVIEALGDSHSNREPPPRRVTVVGAPATEWFVRVRFPARTISYPAVIEFLARRGMAARKFVGIRPECDGSLLYFMTQRCHRPELEGALAALRDHAQCEPTAFRALSH